MGWFDKLKDYAEDAVDWVEDNVDDAEGWVKDKVQDVVGEDNWASDLLDKSGLMDTDLADKAWDYLDEQTDGTWAEEAVDAVDDIGENGIGHAASGLIGEHLGGTWVEDVAEKASEVWDEGIEGAVGAVHGLADEHLGYTWLGDALGKADDVAGGKLSEFWEDEANLVRPISGVVDDAVEGSWAEGVRDHVGTGVGIAGGIFADATEPTGVEAPTMHAAVEPPTDLGISTFQLEQPVDQPIDQPVEPVVEAPAPVEAEPIIEAQFDAMDTDAAPMEEQIVDDIFADDGAMAG